MKKMERKILTIITLVFTVMMTPLTVAASEAATLTFTQGKKLVYSNVSETGSNVSLGTAFEGVAPGETRTQTITLKNENKKTVDFYMSTQVLQALEESRETAAGAGYDIILTANGKELYNSVLGGYTASDSSGSKDGLKEINDSILTDDVLVATLAKGKTADIILQISFDGEAMDNTSAIDYSNALAKVSFDFKVSYENSKTVVTDKIIVQKGDTRYVTKTVEQKIPLAVKTGDTAMIFSGVVVLMAGIALFFFTSKKKTEGNS